PGTSNWQNSMTSHLQDAGILDSVQILIRERTENANWTLAKSGTVCLHPENNRFMILTDPHNIGTLDGSVRHFSSWNDVTWVYMPINAGRVHWVTGAINLTDSIFYDFDSMESESRMLMLKQQGILCGRSFKDEQIPRHLNRNNYFEVPSEMYQEFEEQRMGYQQMKEKNDDMYEKMTRFMEDIRRVPEANTTPIIADQHFGVSDISGFQSYQGVSSSFHTLANNSSSFNMATSSN
nr:hypothetical protein [Tanacetum cinerariifolium]